ncbi:MAG: hypothetical protein EKK40_15250 [Bradyrhizobiaceae bacterium]|nr:MAG: hypothetical protein EKK40_15250 [Bradyrhizobiaceae bacterium]
MQKAVGRSLVATMVMSLCFVSGAYALSAPDTAVRVGKPLVLVNATKSKHPPKKSAHLHRNDRKTAKTGTPAKPVAQAAPATNDRDRGDQAKATAAAALPPDVANARAEITPGDDQNAESASALTEADKTAAIETTSNGVQIAAADQLNDIDRDMAAEAVPGPSVQPMTANDNQSTTAQRLFSQNHSWNGASLIGKIFIGIGAMLTLASAARMLIA